MRALESYTAAALGVGGTELATAVRAGRRLRESGYRLLMRALAQQGNVAEAMQVYGCLCDVMRDELGITPSAETRAVHQQLVRT